MGILAELFFTFLKIGLFTFGGGYAMIAVIEDSCVEKKRWITHEEMIDVAVIAESTPGPIAINSATYVGYKTAGFWGALCATTGVVIPSFIIIYCISSFLDSFLEITWIANAFQGIKVAVGILILDVGLRMLKQMKKNPVSLFLFSFSLVGMLGITVFSLHFTSISILLAAAVVSTVIYLTDRIRRRERQG